MVLLIEKSTKLLLSQIMYCFPCFSAKEIASERSQSQRGGG